MSRLNNFNRLTEMENSAKDKLNHYIRNYLCVVEYMCYCAKCKEKLPYTKNYLASRTDNDIAQIRSTYKQISGEKSEILEEFCQLILQIPNTFDDKYLENVRSKFNDIKEIINTL